MTAEQQAANIRSMMPALVKNALQTAGFQLAASIEKFIDENGPARYPSSSAQWGSQSGRAVRSFIPGQPGNLMRHGGSGNAYSLVYGSDVPYLVWLEEGTGSPKGSLMKARPALAPGFADFEANGMPKLLNDILQKVAAEFNA